MHFVKIMLLFQLQTGWKICYEMHLSEQQSVCQQKAIQFIKLEHRLKKEW